MNYMDFCINGLLMIRDAMKRIDSVNPKIVFVVDNNKLCAALTDGDVRRYLLNGGRLDDNVRNAANHNPIKAFDYDMAIKLYNKKQLIAIPIVDKENNVLDIYFGEEFKEVKHASLNIPVVLNAGGKGTRLYPYTKILPKPLIPIGDDPILEHIMRDYISYGCDDFHIIVNYKKNLIKAFFAENEVGYKIHWYDEKIPLGTGGGLSLLRGKLKSTFFFGNCDTLIKTSFDSIIKFHKERHNTVTMVCAYKNLQIPYGIVEIGKNGCIENMKEKPEMSFLTNTGMYVVESEVIDDIIDGESIGFPDIVKREIQNGNNVAVYPISENEWLDMGQLPELEKMCNKLLGGK